MTDLIRAGATLVFVLALIGLVAWLMRRFGPSMRMGRAGRLGVVETIALDNRRRLVLIRRDKVEHLVLLGNSGDLVIEAGIDDSAAASDLRSPTSLSRGRAEPSFGSHLPGDDA